MTSTSFNVGLNTATRNSSKVLKPPGGGSSDIFGSSGDGGEPQRRGRNHNISSFSLGGEEVATPARKPGNDSFYNLFGTNESQSRPSTAVKDKFRSNIILDQTDDADTTTHAKKTLFGEDNCDKETSAPNNNGECVEVEKNGNEPSCDGCEEVQAVKEEEESTITETPSNKAPDIAPVSESVSTNGSTSSTESTPAPTPTPTASASAPAKQRVPPGGFSSGLW